MGHRTKSLKISKKDRKELEAIAEANANRRLVRRATMVLKAADGEKYTVIAEELGTAPSRVSHWCHRFTDKGISGLNDAPRPGAKKKELVLTEDEREILERYVRRAKSSQRLALRSRIILYCASGKENATVAKELRITPTTVGKWRKRFVEQRLDGLDDDERSGAPRKITDKEVEELIVKTLESTPDGRSHWSTRSMAEKIGISATSVGRIWRTFEIKPHRTETFQLSNDPYFIEKVRNIVGLYMNPPDNAIVLSVDEKTQIQALNRTQPLLPLRPGQVERGTPEYQRNGTTSLFAALDVVTGTVIGNCFPRHRAIEFRKFLDIIKENTPLDQEVHIICDNYSTHKTQMIKKWFARNPRFHIHFTPTHASWLNLIEGWFSILTTQQIKRGSHHSVRELIQAIQEFIDARNANPKPFIWTKTADQVLTRVAAHCYNTLKAHGDDQN